MNMSLNAYSKIENKENIKIITHLIVRDNAQILYGFYSTLEREIFLKLITVNGVGPSTAMMMISSMEVDEIVQAISEADAKKLQKIKGIGVKTEIGRASCRERV